jgi:hypothetical protein
MNLPLFAAMTGEMLPPFAAVLGAVSSQFNFHLLSTHIFHHRVILSSDDRNGKTKTRR